MWIVDIFRVRKLRRELEETKARNRLFGECLRRANALWMEKHPGSKMWPDGADNIVWLLERLTTYEAGLFQAIQTLGLAHAQYLGDAFKAKDWRTFIPDHLLELYDEAHIERKARPVRPTREHHATTIQDEQRRD